MGSLPSSEIRPLPAQAVSSLTLDTHKDTSQPVKFHPSVWSKVMEFCIIANHRGFVHSEITHKIPWSFLRCFFTPADLLSPSTAQEEMCLYIQRKQYLREELCATSTEAHPEICWVVDLPPFTTGSHRRLPDNILIPLVIAKRSLLENGNPSCWNFHREYPHLTISFQEIMIFPMGWIKKSNMQKTCCFMAFQICFCKIKQWHKKGLPPLTLSTLQPERKSICYQVFSHLTHC